MNPEEPRPKQQARRLEGLRHLQAQAQLRLAARQRYTPWTWLTVSAAGLAAVMLVLVVPITAREFWLVAGTAGTIGALLGIAGIRRWRFLRHREDNQDKLAAIRCELAQLEICFPEQSFPGHDGSSFADMRDHVRGLRAARDAQLNDTGESHWQRDPLRLLAYVLVTLLVVALFARIMGSTMNNRHDASVTEPAPSASTETQGTAVPAPQPPAATPVVDAPRARPGAVNLTDPSPGATSE